MTTETSRQHPALPDDQLAVLYTRYRGKITELCECARGVLLADDDMSAGMAHMTQLACEAEALWDRIEESEGRFGGAAAEPAAPRTVGTLVPSPHG